MKTVLRGTLVLACVLVCAASNIQAQTPTAQPQQMFGADRLFQAFVEDAAIVPTQWWEGQIVFFDGPDPLDSTVAMVVAAIQPRQGLEFGGRVGFGNTDAPASLPDGSGATDLDLWGKWHLGSTTQSDFTVGLLLTIPTGDDTAGLGNDSFGAAIFGALRHGLNNAIFTAHAGLRFNEDGMILGIPLDGTTSGIVGVGIIVPLADRLSVVGEANVESERFEQLDSDFRLVGGVNWRTSNRGTLRGALTLGITDGAPDAQLILGYAAIF